MRWPHENGRVFRLFVHVVLPVPVTSIEFLKPTGPKYVGVSAIQFACLCGAARLRLGLVYGRKPTVRTHSGFAVVPSP